MIGMLAGVAALVGVTLGWWGWAAILAGALLAVLILGRACPVVACLLVIAAGLLGAWRHQPNDLSLLAPASLVRSGPGVVASDPIRTTSRQQFVVEYRAEGEAAAPLTERVCVVADALPEVHLGDSVSVSGPMRHASDLPIDVRRFLDARRCVGSVFAETVTVNSAPERDVARGIAGLRHRLGEVLRSAAPGDAGVLLAGLVTGDDAAFSAARREAFVSTGTTHLTAVSGSNLALVAGMLASLGTATLGRHRLLWQIVAIAGIWAYAVISGAQSPVIRAAIVATVAILAFRVGRRADYPTLILLAAGAMALIDPGQVDSLAFQLSVASSLALAVTVSEFFQRDRVSGLAGALVATVAAQLATLPILLAAFGTVSLFSVPANVLVAPLIVVAMPLAACASLAGLVSEPLAGIIAAPAALAASAAIAVIDALGTPSGLVRLGTPPLPATLALAAACGAVLALVSAEMRRTLSRLWDARPIRVRPRAMPRGAGARQPGQDMPSG